jgi:methyltransferase-like protein
MGKFNLTEAAKDILDANVAAKHRGQESGVGETKLKSTIAYGTQDAGIVGQSPEKEDDTLPDYLKGTPSATPPGATPPVGSEKDGVGYTSPKGQPQETQGRADLRVNAQRDATDYESIRDRTKYSAPAQTFHMNPGATFQSYGEDIEAMLSGENLSEDFKEKATMIFEAAVIARSEEVIAEAQVDMQEQFELAVEEIKEELAEKVDGYLNYMVEEWVNDNEIAITKGLRAEIVEDFIGGLRNLFIEHYIDIPEDKVDIVEELTGKVEELEDSLNEQIKSAVELKKELNEHKKFEAIYAACEGLTQTQVEKIKSLAESIEFTSDENFAVKLETIKESYITSSVRTADNSALDDEVQIVEEKKVNRGLVDPEMEVYSKTISQTLIK